MMKTPYKLCIGSILGSLLFTSSANAGVIASPAVPLIYIDGAPQEYDADATVILTNYGAHTETFSILCFSDPNVKGYWYVRELTIGPGETNVYGLNVTPAQFNYFRCEVQVAGNASNMQMMLCNYGSNTPVESKIVKQCFEGR